MAWLTTFHSHHPLLINMLQLVQSPCSDVALHIVCNRPSPCARTGRPMYFEACYDHWLDQSTGKPVPGQRPVWEWVQVRVSLPRMREGCRCARLYI
jgi:hypothetical protein